MTGLLRENIGRVLTLNPPESLTTAAAREALRNANPSQTLFLVTDGATLNDLMANNGWQDMAQVGLELVNPRIWGRTLYVFARTGLDPRLPLKGWVRWAGSTSPDVRDRAAAAMRRLGYVNVTFETMNVAARMVDGFNLGGSGRWRRHRVHLRRGTIVNRRQLCDRRDSREDCCPPAPAGAGRESIDRGRRCSRSDDALQRAALLCLAHGGLIVRYRADFVGGRDSAPRRRARQ